MDARRLPAWPVRARPGRYALSMAKRSKKPADLNRLAAAIISEATDEAPRAPESRQAKAGRAGGSKGGTERAKRLTPERRSEIAREAAKARWGSRSTATNAGSSQG
jgi:hypothetical protein